MRIVLKLGGEVLRSDTLATVAAARSGMWASTTSKGTTTMPPPTPKSAEKTPAAMPMATRRTPVS